MRLVAPLFFALALSSIAASTAHADTIAVVKVFDGEITYCIEFVDTDRMYDIIMDGVDRDRTRMQIAGGRTFVLRGRTCREVDTRRPVAACVRPATVKYIYWTGPLPVELELDCLSWGEARWHVGRGYHPSPSF